MHPYLIHSGHIFLPTFGVLAAVGLMLALGLSERTARLVNLDPGRLWDSGIFTIVAAFVLSRALLIVQNWHTFLNFPVLLLAVPSLTPLGILLAAVATLIYLRSKRVAIRSALDAWAPGAALLWCALALGHFFEGSDPGLAAQSWGGLRTGADATVAHYPVALYAAALALLLCVLLYRRLQAHPAPGRTCGLALIAIGGAQYLLCFLREPSLEPVFGLDALQWVSLAMIAGGGVLLALPAPAVANQPTAAGAASK